MLLDYLFGINLCLEAHTMLGLCRCILICELADCPSGFPMSFSRED